MNNSNPDEITPISETPAVPKGMAMAREIFEWLELFTFAAVFVLLLFLFFMRIAMVQGPSMEDTLHEKQIVVFSDLFYEPKQGDIVVFQTPLIGYQEPIVKRIIATAGQEVDIDFDTWEVKVDGTVIEEPYVKTMTASMLREDFHPPYIVPEGKVFVMGDNRNRSMDSRSNNIGAVDVRYILGELKFRIFPFNKFGTVK